MNRDGRGLSRVPRVDKAGGQGSSRLGPGRRLWHASPSSEAGGRARSKGPRGLVMPPWLRAECRRGPGTRKDERPPRVGFKQGVLFSARKPLVVRTPFNAVLPGSFRVQERHGLHSVTALCTLRVTIITDDMLTNSITVRLENMSQEKFLSPLLSLFVEGLAAVLSTSTDGIFVFNIQNDTDVSANILNVTFSALLPGGVRGRFFPSEALQEQIYLNRTLLRLISAQRVLPFDDNICLREPCENYMKCVSVLRFDSSAPFISSTTVLFRPIHPVGGLRCRCPPGFTGDYCETEIDLCYSSPCGSHGLCRSREGGYTCHCHEDYTGEYCEVNARSGRCAPGVCKNGGKCVNLLVGGFKCECPPGEFERPYCGVTTRSFPAQSFVTFKGLRQRFHFTLSLTLLVPGPRTPSPVSASSPRPGRAGPLAVSVPPPATPDLPALSLRRHPEVVLAGGDAGMRPLSPCCPPQGETRTSVAPVVRGGVSDGRWHSVRVQYYNKPHIGRLGIPHGPSGEKVAVVSVDDCDTAVAVRFGGRLANYSCAAQGTQTGSKKSLDLTGPLLLGGVPNLPEDFPVHNRQFVGCMRNLSIDNQAIDMESFIANNGTRAGCTAQENHCDSIWCQNGGTCVNKWNMYICSCPLRYGGKNCEQVMPHPQRFSGESLVFWGDLDITISVPWYLGLMFRTRKASGTLLAANAGTSSKISLQILNSHVYFAVFHGSSEVASMRLGRSRVSDGEWHHLLIELKSAKDGKDITYLAVMTLDYGLDQNTVQIGNHLPGLKMRSVLVGGLSEDQVTVQQGFSGCMQGVRMGETATNIVTLNMKEALQVRVKDGCATDDPCASSPCPEHSRCLDSWDGYACVCEPGYFGRDCVDACHLNPCEHVSACVRKPSSTQGYACECGHSYYGQYCESKRLSPCAPVIYSGCPRAFEAGIWWPQTKFGQPAAVPCPKGSVGNAIRHCSSEKGWLPPELFNCTTSSFLGLKATNEKLHRNETRLDGDKSVQLARALENATRSAATLYGNDVRTAYQVLMHVLRYESRQQGFELAATRDAEFNENLIRAGSALLDATHKDSWEQIQRTEGGTAHLLRHYEDYFSTLVKNMRRTYMKPFVIVTDNMILAAAVFDEANFTGARVPRFEDLREGYPRDLQSSVLFPAHLFEPSDRRDAPTVKPSKPRGTPGAPPRDRATRALSKRRKRQPDTRSQHAVGLVLICRSLGQLLPELYDPDRRSLRLPHRPVINSPIVSTLLHSEGERASAQPGHPILVEYTLLETQERTKPVCVFWNHSLGSLGAGGWSAKGCELVSRNNSHITCQCSHTSSLAVLMDISKREHGEVLPLKIVTYTSVAVSLVALLMAFILLLVLRTLRANLHSIHRNLIAALFSSQLVFVIGIDQTENPFTCTVIAILLHYFYMSTFAWLFVEGLHIYRMLTEVRNIDSGHMRFYYVLGWGIPAIVTGLAVGLDPQGYGNPDFCWLSVHDTLIWSFAGPIGIVVLINTVIFVLSARAACRREHRTYDRAGIASGLRTAFLLLLLISATWLLGLMAVNSDVMAFHYLFAVFSCLQGVAIFLFHCVLNKEVQKHLKLTLMGKKAHPDDSTATRATLLTRSLNCNNTYIEEPNMYRTALGESTASLDSTIREEGTKKLSVSSSQARGRPDSDTHLFRRRNSKNPRGNDSDSDSELSLEEHSSSYASSRSSDSEEDGVDEENKWNSGSCKANDRGPIHSTPKADTLSNHIKATWPPDSMTGSDGEDARCKPKLKVETKVNVELHQENQEDDGKDAPSDKENPGLPRDNQTAPQTNHQHPEQRKGILKNKVTYPPPLTERNLKNRLREKLADYNQTVNSSRTSSLGSNDGICPTVDPGVTVKNSPREHSCDQLNGVVMNVRTGTVHADASDSEGSNETSI
ncbi:cadherin EGF LAG seven-pass G-type receptor 1 [Gracilinanus agilis]|uniref:cadherin EGF LAG seven-pass G-type receptor 1 n=1 Tax=Gracilinanus agilis TaxID=191870 RepID=UPI001CFC5771|nr:cadherin EGF LAG seven-pass G-type receptor 1 [Gracilinanus agilis]